MASPTYPMNDPLFDPDTDPAPRRLVLWITLIAVAAVTLGWVYVLFIYRPQYLIDELHDRTFPERAEQVCAAARSRYDELPLAQNANTQAERAKVVESSNVIFGDMLDQLRYELDTVPLDDRDAVSEWIDDWGVYLSDRQRYVVALREQDDARFLETAKGSDTKGISRAVDSFAQVNRMLSCVTPGDVS